MSTFPPRAESQVSRRQAFKIGGITVSLAALVAACGDDREGDTAPGRVGYAPPVTDPPDYTVDDAVRLRTASSLEYSVIAVYERALESGIVEPSSDELVSRLIDNHQASADQLAALTDAEGGVPWECTNPWLDDRLIEPVLQAIQSSDDPARDLLRFAVALENLAASTHQVFAVELTAPAAKTFALETATSESRQSAALVAIDRGPDGYISPEVYGEGVPTDVEGLPNIYSITSRFGSVGQAELIVGPADENGSRESFNLQTPAENSFIYNELEPTC
jgi:hypothetical protein